jgi:alkylhydroperoxidase family enzyme
MARLPYVDLSTVQEPYRNQFRNNVNITRALANSPTVALESGKVARFIREDLRIDPRLRELAIIQVGYSAKSAYEYTHHIEIGLKAGVSEDDVRAIAIETMGRPSGIDPLAKAVLRAAREMTDGIAMSDATFAELRKSLNNEQLVDLIFAIANYNAVVRLLATLQVDLEDEYKEILAKFPMKG